MSITLTREQLYHRVWTDPIDRLCKDFGLSNVGLRKVCVRHHIPVPARGYWAKKEHGHTVKQPPLPSITGLHIATEITFGERVIRPSAAQAPILHPLIEFERRPENAVHVPETLQARHPLIRATRDYWAAVKRHEVKYGGNKLPYLNVRVSADDEEQRHAGHAEPSGCRTRNGGARV